MPGADILRVAITRKAHGGRATLGRVGFDAAPGEVLALLAPSGTGKTTALRIVLGLDRAFVGSVARPPGRLSAVFQEPRLLPWLDVAGNLRLVAPALDDTALEALLAPLGLPGAGRLMPGRLSLGMARRVALARAMAVAPTLLVLDEPFASLDPMLSRTIGTALMARCRAAGTIVLLATHDLDQALRVADRLLILTGAAPAELGADIATGQADAADIRARFAFLEGSGA